MKEFNIENTLEAYNQLMDGSNNLNDYIAVIIQIQDKSIEVSVQLATRIVKILSVGALSLKDVFMLDIIEKSDKTNDNYIFATGRYLYANEISLPSIAQFLSYMPEPFKAMEPGAELDNTPSTLSNDKKLLMDALIKRGYIKL